MVYQREPPSSQVRSRSSTGPKKKAKLTEALALDVFAFVTLVRCAGSVALDIYAPIVGSVALDTCASIVGCVRVSVGVGVSFALQITCLL